MHRDNPDRFNLRCMLRSVLTAIALLLYAVSAQAKVDNIIVADSTTHRPLANASIFDAQGIALGMSNSNGRLPYISQKSFPITVRYLGYHEKRVDSPDTDTIFLREQPMDLPEITIETHDHRILHMLAYVREYSTLTTYSDTVFLFREKMVDFMLPFDKRTKFKGWHSPRIIKSKSYYRFSNTEGRDSVSNTSNHHFSWSDWIGVAPTIYIPNNLKADTLSTDTVYGRYSPTEIWTRNNDNVIVDVNVLADTTSRRWVPDIALFFRDDVEFDEFKIRFNYDNVVTDSVSPLDLTGYTYTIDSRGRGRDMFKFNRSAEPYFTNTYAEVYMLDKEYITLKEARKWDKIDFSKTEIDIYQPPQAPPLQASVLQLVNRVDNIDHIGVRLNAQIDPLLAQSLEINRRGDDIGRRMLRMLKGVTGITSHKSKKNLENKWDRFSQQQLERNSQQQTKE